MIRSDRHPYFVSEQMHALFDSHDVEHRVSASYNAGEHGGAERRVGMVFEHPSYL